MVPIRPSLDPFQFETKNILVIVVAVVGVSGVCGGKKEREKDSWDILQCFIPKFVTPNCIHFVLTTSLR